MATRGAPKPIRRVPPAGHIAELPDNVRALVRAPSTSSAHAPESARLAQQRSSITTGHQRNLTQPASSRSKSKPHKATYLAMEECYRSGRLDETQYRQFHADIQRLPSSSCMGLRRRSITKALNEFYANEVIKRFRDARRHNKPDDMCSAYVMFTVGAGIDASLQVYHPKIFTEMCEALKALGLLAVAGHR